MAYKLANLIEDLNKIVQEHPEYLDKVVVLDGCDCVEDCGGIEAGGVFEGVFLVRQDHV